MWPWIIAGVVILTAAIIFYALRGKGDVSASMSLWRLLEFKLDAKEKRSPSSKDPQA
jgi:hypothetical protein